MQLRTNNGDDRMKAHDVFPAVCYPDLFWRLAKENLNQDWYLMDPHDIMQVKGYCLEDSFGEEWGQIAAMGKTLLGLRKRCQNL